MVFLRLKPIIVKVVEISVPAYAGKRQLKASEGPFRPENDKSC
jgi:hypothetical protein